SAITPTGLAEVSTSIGTPAFDASGTRVVFNPMAGPTEHPKQSLIVMDFANDTRTFANPRTVVDLSAEDDESRPGWPAFLPDGESLVFHYQTKAGGDGNNAGDLYTRKGAKAQLYWTRSDDASSVTALNA